ncbi:integrase core domain-containing protein [Chromohalobacter canadensis]|uniref:integrase core domain-containing protein n=1 Tax=Chromohalobacter canadensis TaxID=141389 RepID=UPI00117E8227
MPLVAAKSAARGWSPNQNVWRTAPQVWHCRIRRPRRTTWKEECIWLHRFESLGQARVMITRWIRCYKGEGPHQSLDYVAPRAHRINGLRFAETRGALQH